MEKVTEILVAANGEILATKNTYELEQARSKYLGKKGLLTEVLKTLGNLSAEEKPKIGAVVNEAKNKVLALLNQQENALQSQALESKLQEQAIDITLPGRGKELGSLHPLTQVTEEVTEFFLKMGFSLGDGHEIEDEHYNFDALNFPIHHPAKNSADTFYFDTQKLLRTHTSPVQIRFSQEYSAPLRMVVHGRVYRRDFDATHTPMFHQFEGLVIDQTTNFANLKWMLNSFLRSFFGKNVVSRFRPSYFPFTEPSGEVDILWEKDGQKKWLEILGCGMVHPNVLLASNIDPKRFQGFAFGMGLDRLTMLRYGINDLRLIFENDQQFLKQF
jgi:phenylalanyl-tRNA synthetase alpha chain